MLLYIFLKNFRWFIKLLSNLYKKDSLVKAHEIFILIGNERIKKFVNFNKKIFILTVDMFYSYENEKLNELLRISASNFLMIDGMEKTLRKYFKGQYVINLPYLEIKYIYFPIRIK